MGFYPVDVVVQDAARHGVVVQPPDVTCSGVSCTVEGETVQLGLRLVRGLGTAAAGRVAAAMAGEHPPASLEDLCRGARLDEGEIRALAHAGALRSFEPDRHAALWAAPAAALAARGGGLAGLGGQADPPAALPPADAAAEWTLDVRALGVSTQGHALAPLRAELRRRGLRALDDLGRLPAETMVRVAGQTVSLQRPGTARGTVFLCLSDETGLGNAVLRPDVYARCRAVVRAERLIEVYGVVERRDGGAMLRVLDLRPLAAQRGERDRA